MEVRLIDFPDNKNRKIPGNGMGGRNNYCGVGKWACGQVGKWTGGRVGKWAGEQVDGWTGGQGNRLV
jgi:hypothetical protein